MNEVKSTTTTYIKGRLVLAVELRYSDVVKDARPGIASANRPRIGPFRSLLEQIRHDESALDALAYAYGELSAPERRGLMHAVVQDALDPTRALGAFLAVESDPTLANRLAVLIGKHGGPGRLATIDGDGGRGEACLIQPLHGLTAERMRIAWNQNKIEGIEIEPRIDMKSVSQGPFVAVARAVDTLAPLIWRHVRSGGELPQGVERFAGFFSLE